MPGPEQAQVTQLASFMQAYPQFFRNIGVRPARHDSETEFFAGRPDVPAFHQGNEAVFNPGHPAGMATIPNEAIRLFLRDRAPELVTATQITPEQNMMFARKALAGQLAERSQNDIAATILARGATGDSSAGQLSGQQAALIQLLLGLGR